MKTIIGLLILLSCSVSVAAWPEYLEVGEEASLPGKESRLWISDSKKLKALTGNGHLVLKPLKEGVVEIRSSQGARVLPLLSPAAARTYRILQKKTKVLVGLETALSKEKVILKGRLHRIEDFDELFEAIPDEADWELRAKMSQEVQDALSIRVARKLGLEERPALQFAEAPQWLFAGGIEESQKLQVQLRRFGIRVVRDTSAVATEPVIRVEIAVAEVRRDALKSYGIGWPTSAEAKLLADGTLQRPELIFSAKAFESAGNGRLLARPTILCRSGKEAEFVAGGEFPIKIFNRRAQDVIWKRYGITVHVKPKADLSGRISLGLEVEVSSIDPTRVVDGIPGLLTNRVASHFDLSRPRLIALSGLIKQEEGQSREGLLGLSSLPILGPLFSSREWRENRTELVIFVRPEIVKEM